MKISMLGCFRLPCKNEPFNYETENMFFLCNIAYNGIKASRCYRNISDALRNWCFGFPQPYLWQKYSVLDICYIKTVLANRKSIKKVWSQVKEKHPECWELEWSDKSCEISTAGGAWETAFYSFSSHLCAGTWMRRSPWYWSEQKSMYLLYLHELELTSWALHQDFFALAVSKQQSFEVLSKRWWSEACV